MRILGIDEAGKGPVIGPMVLCGYLIDDSRLKTLSDIGVKDSKLLSNLQRRTILPKIKELSDDYMIKKLYPKDIDARYGKHNLNVIEMEKMKELIELFEPDKVFIDAFEANTEKFKMKLSSMLRFKANIIAENYADKNYTVVGAASIIAKVERDDEIEKLKKEYGYDFGTGYPSDPQTIEFLKTFFKKNRHFPDFVRKTWITAKEIKNILSQKSLLDIN